MRFCCRVDDIITLIQEIQIVDVTPNEREVRVGGKLVQAVFVGCIGDLVHTLDIPSPLQAKASHIGTDES
jgi:hypothetical protein